MTAGLPLIKSVINTLPKSVLLPLGLSAGKSAANAAIEKKIYGLGTTTLIISNEEIKDIMKIFKNSGLLIKGVSEAIKDPAKEQKKGFLGILLNTLSTILLGISLTGREVIRGGERTVRAGEFSMLLHPLTNFEIQKYYENEPKYNGVYSRNNLSKIKDGAYIVNLDEYQSIGTHWIALNHNDNDVTYFDSFGVKNFPNKN